MILVHLGPGGCQRGSGSSFIRRPRPVSPLISRPTTLRRYPIGEQWRLIIHSEKVRTVLLSQLHNISAYLSLNITASFFHLKFWTPRILCPGRPPPGPHATPLSAAKGSRLVKSENICLHRYDISPDYLRMSREPD